MPGIHLERILPYPADVLFDLVADIKHYPEFVPWCEDIQILASSSEKIESRVTVGYKTIQTHFHCYIHLHPEKKDIQVEQIAGPFKHFKQHWHFTPSGNGQKSQVIFEMDFSLASLTLNTLAKMVCPAMCEQFIKAFVERAGSYHRVI